MLGLGSKITTDTRRLELITNAINFRKLDEVMMTSRH